MLNCYMNQNSVILIIDSFRKLLSRLAAHTFSYEEVTIELPNLEGWAEQTFED